MSILIHAPSQVRYGSQHVHPTPTPPNHPHRTTQNNFYVREEEDFARSQSFREKKLSREEAFREEDFARSRFCEKVLFREEYTWLESIGLMIQSKSVESSSQSTRDIELCLRKSFLSGIFFECVRTHKSLIYWSTHTAQTKTDARTPHRQKPSNPCKTNQLIQEKNVK